MLQSVFFLQPPKESQVRILLLLHARCCLSCLLLNQIKLCPCPSMSPSSGEEVLFRFSLFPSFPLYNVALLCTWTLMDKGNRKRTKCPLAPQVSQELLHSLLFWPFKSLHWPLACGFNRVCLSLALALYCKLI